LVCWIQQPEQIAKNEVNRDRAIRAVKQSFVNLIALYCQFI
jgi:hypothetical protein